ncbi:hypothetical protein ACFQUU_08875 [Herbaspirillum sp. GCM10030257]|uniref:hypothetical protein n=1 Tax=Herbaspirillum sp. GCM10030257 TaxID=3273393 RepID=UPI00361D68DE
MDIKHWIYFGCHRQVGHYLFLPGMRPRYDRQLDKLTHFDGKLPPQGDATPYVAAVSRLGGWGLSALAFWDYSVDNRGGSNSVFYAPSLTITPEELMAGAKQHFPEVWARLPEVRLAVAPPLAGNPPSALGA